MTFTHFENPSFPKTPKSGAETQLVPVSQSSPKRRDETWDFWFLKTEGPNPVVPCFQKSPAPTNSVSGTPTIPVFSDFNRQTTRAETPTIPLCQGPSKQRHGTPKISVPQSPFRGTSLIAKHFPLEPCTRHTPMVLRRSEGGGVSYERGTPAKQETKGRAPRSLPPRVTRPWVLHVQEVLISPDM